jgi:hypothetical protein
MGDRRFPNAPDRLAKDPLIPLVRELHGQEYSKQFLTAVDWALQFQAKDRPHSVEQWRKAFPQRGSSSTNNRNGRKSELSISPNALKICALVAGVVFATAVLAILILALSGSLW